MSKMLGIDLNVDNEYMEQVVKDTVLFGINANSIEILSLK